MKVKSRKARICRGLAVFNGVNLSQAANVIHGYTNKVRLRGLRKNQGFETHAGGFYLGRRGF